MIVPPEDRPELQTLLDDSRPRLSAWLQKNARGLLRFEAVDDLLQGVHLQAFEAWDRFRWQGEPAFLAFLFTLAKRHVADRHHHWSALKRGSGRVLRITYGSASGDSRAALPPPAGGPGPATFASRREQLVLAARALAALPEKDRALVLWSSEDVDLHEQAQRLGMSYAAVQRARLRALERFRKTFELVSRHS